MTQAPAEITQHGGGYSRYSPPPPPPAFLGSAARRVSTGNKALHGLLAELLTSSCFSAPKYGLTRPRVGGKLPGMWPRFGGKAETPSQGIPPPQHPQGAATAASLAALQSRVPTRTLLITFYYYYYYKLHVAGAAALEGALGIFPPTPPHPFGASFPPTYPSATSPSSCFREPALSGPAGTPAMASDLGRGGAEPATGRRGGGGREEKISTVSRVM